MNDFRMILTHPGGAHRDEFLATSVLLAARPVPVERREPAAADLDDPTIAVLDCGDRHEPANLNFDHHQFPADHPPTCSLSLVLRHLGLEADARQFCEWFEPAEWFDSRGPIETARWLGIERTIVNRLGSPMDATLLRRFARSTRLEPGQPLWEIMRMIGEDLLSYLRTQRHCLDYVERHAEFWEFSHRDETVKILFLARREDAPDELSGGMEAYLETRGLAAQITGLVYPDRRNTGYGLARFRDNPRLDFTRITGRPGIHFTHARGFLAKTTVTEPTELRNLIREALR